MSTNFYFRSLKIDNYRGLKNLDIDSLRRVNLIGGLNGTGKSTLLDAIFLFLDRRNPISLTRPLAWRGLQVPFPNGLDYVFGYAGTKSPAKMSLKTIRGNFEFTLSHAKPTVPINITSANNPLLANQIAPTTVNTDQTGIEMKTVFNGKEDEVSYTVQTGAESIAFNLSLPGTSQLAPCTFVSAATRITPVEDAQRFSQLVKDKRSVEIVNALKFINDQLDSFILLQEGNQPTLYAQMKDGTMLQTSMLGGGFQSVLSIVLLLMVTKDGVVLFDEVDAAIHYSKLSFFWSLTGRLAEQQNCQIFAVTHSRECIENALKGFEEEKRLSDLQYLRLENDDNETDCIAYTGEELTAAIASNWEIR